ncbi:hypothetical protein [Flavobacterium cutihirudinis]|uniref:hypothetical protein n=1 Tax=Flavobacterium cutihirudinis TaxID=1265740 RepID=UPI00142E4A8E|nr:hypothetical protein [Flavobacterium cutihirudinis]
MKILLHPGVLFIVGFVLNGIAWTVKLGPVFSTICLLLGLGLIFSSIILFIIKVRS